MQIVRGEGEATTVRLIHALDTGASLKNIPGTVFRKALDAAADSASLRPLSTPGVTQATPPAPLIRDLDAYRVGWELMDHARYSYWGNRRAAVVQFSRGCPHRWTPYFRRADDRRVIQTDLSRWDYKHQVLATRKMPPWRIIAWTKLIEAVVQLRPKSLWRVLAHPDPTLREAMRWYYRIGRQVWPYELWHFLFRDRRINNGPTLRQFLGQPQDREAEVLEETSLSLFTELFTARPGTTATRESLVTSRRDPPSRHRHLHRPSPPTSGHGATVEPRRADGLRRLHGHGL